MTNTEKRIKNQKIKETIKHILHVVCYVLSVAFIILMVIVGAQSCQKTSSQSAQQESHTQRVFNYKDKDYFVYNLKTFGSNPIEISFSNQNLFDYSEHIDTSIHYQTQQSSYQLYVPNLDGFIERNGTLVYFGSISLKYKCMPYYENEEIQYYSYRLQYIYFQLNWGYPNGIDYETYYLVNWYGGDQVANYNDYNFNNSGDLHVVLNWSEIDYYFFNYFFEPFDSYDFIFNDNFNYNAPSMLPIGNQLWKDDEVKDTFEQDFYSDLQIGWFYTNGMVFDTIRYVYQNSNSMKFSNSKDTSWNNAMSGGNGYAFYKELRYYNSETSASWVVNTRDLYWVESGLGVPAYIYLNTTTWRDKGFTKITLLTELSDSNRVLLGSFNNNDLNSVITGFQNNGYNGDIFSLLSSAFTSILPVLNIMVLPNITIGILMFVPLVAMLVFAIIRIIKK